MKILWYCMFGLLAFWTAAESAQYPDKSITLVVPYAPGGTTDAVGRVLAEKLSALLKQTVVVENASGAGSTVGAAKVARANSDGYTLFFNNMSQALSSALYARLPYDPIDDFEPIGLVGELPMMLVGRADYEPKDIKALVAWMQANAATMTIGNGGIGGSTHLCAMVVLDTLKLTMTHVPYKGSGPALLDLIGGRLDLICDSPGSSTGHIQAGALKGYALTSKERIKSMPEVPTFTEAGFPDVDLMLWHGLYAPKGTPKAVIDRLSSALQDAVTDQDFRTRMEILSIQAETAENAKPEPLMHKLRTESKRWGELIRRAGVTADF